MTPPELEGSQHFFTQSSPYALRSSSYVGSSPDFCIASKRTDEKAIENAKCRINFDLPTTDLSFDDMSYKDCGEADVAEVEKDDGYGDGYDDDDDQEANVAAPAFREFRETSGFDCENTTMGFQSTTNCSVEGTQSQSQDTGYQTQNSQSVINEATLSSNLTNQFSNLHAVLGSKDNGDASATADGADVIGTDLRNSIEEMSQIYSQIVSNSFTELTPSATSRDRHGARVDRLLSSTMLSPTSGGTAADCHVKDKPMNQVFEELQQFADKFADSSFSNVPKHAVSGSGRPGAVGLHKSYSVNEIQALRPSIRAIISDSQDLKCGPVSADRDHLHNLVEVSPNTESLHSSNQVFDFNEPIAQATDIAQDNDNCGAVIEMPSLNRVVTTRPKLLTRSVSDFTGASSSSLKVTDVNIGCGDGGVVTSSPRIVRGLSARANPAFTIETLTPSANEAVTSSAARDDDRSLRPRLLFADNASNAQQGQGRRGGKGKVDDMLPVGFQQKRKFCGVLSESNDENDVVPAVPKRRSPTDMKTFPV